MRTRRELAQQAVELCEAEIESGVQGLGDFGGSVAYLAVTATFVAMTEILRGLTCQEVNAGTSYVPCHRAAWLQGRQVEWCQVCQLRHELVDIEKAQTRMMIRRRKKGPEQ